MVKSATKLWIAEKSRFKPQAISLNLFLYSKQSAYHELTNSKLYYFLKWLQYSRENWGCCLRNKNSPCSSSETALPIRTQPHHQDGLCGPCQTLAVLLGLLNTFFMLSVIWVHEYFLRKPISSNLVTDICNCLAFLFFWRTKLWAGLGFLESFSKRQGLEYYNCKCNFWWEKLGNEDGYVVLLKDYQSRFVQALLQDCSTLKSSWL